MLLAAGWGARMEPLSSLIPKPALDVLGQPLLASALGHLLAASCTPIVVNLHRHPQAVAAAARSAAGGRAELTFSHEATLAGSAGGIAAARRYFAPGPLLVANADGWATLDLAPLGELGRADRAVLGLVPHPNIERWSTVELGAGGVVRRIAPPGDHTVTTPYLFTGFQLLGEELLADLPPPPADMAPVWRGLIARRALFGVPLAGTWREAGTPGGYRQLISDLLAGSSWRHRDAKVEGDACLVGSALGAACSLGAGSMVIDSVVTGGARVGPGVYLQRCVVAGKVEIAAGEQLSDQLVLPGGCVPLV